ncbi:flagellar motor switch protein FliM [uncultured Sphingomonas sp.]|uniref:flagellar motor switch protein FliM n=1 Tax=uncultured Sphingomonas sp. TaxID=158754 RepID=UPI0035CB440C
MVNGGSSQGEQDRRDRPRDRATHAPALGVANLNPFGDLNTLQHLSARLARSLRSVFEPVLRREVRAWAEPLRVQRFTDYRAERTDALTAWIPMTMTMGGAPVLLVIDGRFAIELLDLFFGGPGGVPHDTPSEFSPAAEAMLMRLGAMIADPMTAAWEPLASVSFQPGRIESNPSMISGVDTEDPVVITRFGLGHGPGAPVTVDIVYPVAALKPHTPSLTGKVLGKGAALDPAWQNGLARAVMQVTFPVRSVLAEPTMPLARLMDLKQGDVIPISFTSDVPVMVGGDRLGTGTVGTSNGRAAIRLNTINRLHEEESA